MSNVFLIPQENRVALGRALEQIENLIPQLPTEDQVTLLHEFGRLSADIIVNLDSIVPGRELRQMIQDAQNFGPGKDEYERQRARAAAKRAADMAEAQEADGQPALHIEDWPGSDR